jgi:hypothetical protein
MVTKMVTNFPAPAVFVRQFNTRWDRTNRDNTGTTKFQDRCLKPLGHPSLL